MSEELEKSEPIKTAPPAMIAALAGLSKPSKAVIPAILEPPAETVIAESLAEIVQPIAEPTPAPAVPLLAADNVLWETELEMNKRARKAAGLDVPKSTAEVLATQAPLPAATPVYESDAAFNMRCHLEQLARDAAAKSGTPSTIPQLQPPVPPEHETLEQFKSKLEDYSSRVQPNRRIVR
jgi:hypothetical protein